MIENSSYENNIAYLYFDYRFNIWRLRHRFDESRFTNEMNKSVRSEQIKRTIIIVTIISIVVKKK